MTRRQELEQRLALLDIEIQTTKAKIDKCTQAIITGGLSYEKYEQLEEQLKEH